MTSDAPPIAPPLATPDAAIRAILALAADTVDGAVVLTQWRDDGHRVVAAAGAAAASLSTGDAWPDDDAASGSVTVLRPDGSECGRLGVVDARGAGPQLRATLGRFAALIAFHLDADAHLASSDADLVAERATAALREQFIAVLGHDLRNPLASVASGIRLLRGNQSPERTERIMTLMEGSVDRMVALIDNVLDLAHGRLGGGLAMTPRPVDLVAILRQVVAELQASHATRPIALACALPPVVSCDGLRLGQLCSNLIGNALTHGTPGTPVSITADTTAAALRVAVTNHGPPMDAATIARLFQPFTRASVRPGQGGLGLGLYIAAEIARAHGGRIDVASDAAATCFTFVMPLPA